MSQEQNQPSQAESVSGEDGSLDEAAAAFAAPKQAEQEQTDEPKAEDGTEEGADAETDPEEGGEPEEEPTEDEAVELEFEGQKFQAPKELAEKLEKALLRQSDYSRKMNEVGAKEKTASQRLEQAEKLIESVEKRAEALAEVNMMDARIKEYEKLDWVTLRKDNPAEFAATAAEFQSLRLVRDEATRKAQAVEQQVAQAKFQQLSEKRSDMLQTLEKSLAGWGDKMGTEITQYAIQNGYTGDQIAQITDPQWVIAMHKAMKYDALQKGKSELKAKAKDAPPVLKPGAAKPRVDAKAETLARLRKTGTTDDAAAAFAARMN